MIEISGKIYRNLQEQVYENQQNIEDIKDEIQDIEDVQIPAKMSNPMTAGGDIIIGGTAGAPTRLAKGSNGQVLSTDGVSVYWDDPEIEGEDVKATGVTADKVLTADGSGGSDWKDIVPPEGDEIGSLGESAGKVLTSDGDDGAYWSTMEGNMIGSIGMSAGKVLKANGSGGATWGDETPEGTDVKSTSESSGKVLTSNGSGGASWQSVPQNFTGSVSGIAAVISVGTNQLSSSSGSNGQVMGWSGGPTWGKPGSNFGLGYTTTTPTANNSDGLKIAVLSSDPGTKYNGWIYIITA